MALENVEYSCTYPIDCLAREVERLAHYAFAQLAREVEDCVNTLMRSVMGCFPEDTYRFRGVSLHFNQ